MIIFLSLLACRKSEYHLFEPDKSNSSPDEEETIVESWEEAEEEAPQEPSVEDTQEISPEDIEPSMRLDAAIQHMKWGDQLMRCQIQVAFSRRWYPPPEEPEPQEGEEEEEPDPQQGQQPPQEPPQNPGDCVFMRHERPEQDGPPPQQDNWFISGDIFGPEALFMHSDEQTIVLEKTMAEDGFVRYEMLDCRQDTFPFGEVFDLEIPASEGEDTVPEAYIEEALSFGPNIIIETPNNIPQNQQYQGFGEDGLFFSWSFGGSVPETADEEITVRLTNNSNRPWNYDERMECLPDSRSEIDLTGSDLTQFTLSEYIGEGIFSIGLNVHGDYYGPEREDPWGHMFRSRVNVARGGMMELAK